MEFVAVGEAMLDVIANTGSRHGRVTVRPGGTAVNAALAAATLGASAAVIARVGRDFAGAAISAELEAAGVTALLKLDESAATGCFVQIGEATVADRGASGRLTAADVAIPAESVAVLVSGYTLLHEDTRPAAEAALEAGLPWTAVDVGTIRVPSLDRLSAPRVLFANRDEAYALTGHDGYEAARALAQVFEVACVKLGVEGAVACWGDEVATTLATALVPGLSTGAGDAFDAAVLVALSRGTSLRAALKVGAETAARALRTEPRAQDQSQS